MTILDVGCGYSPKSLELDGVDYIVGVDLFEPYLRLALLEGCAAVKLDARKIGDIFLEDSFDGVFLCDIIEHLEKEDGLKLIEDSKKIAHQAVILEVGAGYIPQNLDITGYRNHELQTHRSAWTVKELEDLGFECVVKPYKMKDVKRHTTEKVNLNIEQIYAIYK
jgi:hypothetical protein